MGIKYVDKYTLGHLFGGILSCSLLQYSNIPVAINFTIANGIHYMIEQTEKSVAPNGRVLESYENHIGDITAFLLGWMIAYALRMDRYITSKNALVLWVVLLFFTALEFLREMYPYEKLINGAYTDDE
jgi:hypothetical protein